MKQSRLARLFRAFGTLALGFVRSFTAPKWTREFLAYVYLYRPLSYSERIKPVALRNILEGVDGFAVEMRKCHFRHGNMTGEEIVALCLLIRWARPRGIFEFGTFNGNTTLQMVRNSPDDCRIATLNLPMDHGETRLPSSAQDELVHPSRSGSGDVFRGEPEHGRIRELFGDSAVFDFGPFRGEYDFVLIDAGHEYEYVKSDTENGFRLLPDSGGVLVWHDFPNAPGVCAWLEELSRSETIYHVEGTRLAFSIRGTALRAEGRILKPGSGASDRDRKRSQ